MSVELKPIGVIHTPFKTKENMPIQPAGGKGVEGHIEVFDEFKEGLSDLDGFSHIYIIFHLHESKEHKLKVKPFLDTVERGVFSTRSPSRPNPIGLSIVEVVSVEDNRVKIKNLDILDGTPLLDIKPFTPVMENFENVRSGWLEGKTEEVAKKRSDDRF